MMDIITLVLKRNIVQLEKDISETESMVDGNDGRMNKGLKR